MGQHWLKLCCLMASIHYLYQCWLPIADLRAILQRVPKLQFCITSFKIILFKLLPHLPGANELSHISNSMATWLSCNLIPSYQITTNLYPYPYPYRCHAMMGQMSHSLKLDDSTIWISSDLFYLNVLQECMAHCPPDLFHAQYIRRYMHLALCCVLWSSLLMVSLSGLLLLIIIRLPQCQWSNPDELG